MTIIGIVASLFLTIIYSVREYGNTNDIVMSPWFKTKKVISSDYKGKYRIAYERSENRTYLYQELFFGFLLKCICIDRLHSDDALRNWLVMSIEYNETKYVKPKSPFDNFNGYINKKDERLNKIDKVL